MKRRKRILSALLAATMILSSAAVSAPVTAEAAVVDTSLPTLTVDMTPAVERELKHGSSGWLYGQGDESVPTANTMTPLKPHTSVAKAPNGMQHPNGDTLDIAETFLNAGGNDIQIYVPDYYALWFYEFSSTEEYLKILEMEAQACIDKGIAEEVVYVLYNEPSESWIGGSYTDPETGTRSTGWNSLFWFWEDMYDLVVEVYERNGIESKPRFAGLNLAVYDNTVMENYIKFCVEHNCMPDVVTWHDLATWQFDIFGNEYNHYKGLEAKYLTKENAEKYGVDITPREIVINEYAAQAECSSPGDLVRWIGLFEEYNVSGCMPFWHLSNNLNGIAADNNEGNGAWWLYKWYGDMSGQYLPVTTSNAAKNDYYGVASLDNNKKSANVVFGGINGSSNIVLDDIVGTETFANADKVHVKVEATDYTGFHGVAEEPRVIKEGAVEVVNGKAIVPISDMLEMSAYRITVTQATEDEEIAFLSTTWKQKYEAENGILSGRAAFSAADGGMACSGRNKVGWLWDAADAVSISVDVPQDGYYKFDLVYTAGNGCNTGDPSQNTPYTAYQDLVIDGTQVERMILPTTLNFGMGSMYSTYIYLAEGAHTVKLAGADNSTRSADSDCIYLTYKGPELSDTEFNKLYQAELSEFNELGTAKTALTTERDGNIDYVSGLEKISVTKGGGLRFNAIVPDNGMYTLKLRYSADVQANANIYQDNDTVNLNNLTATIALENTNNEWKNAYQTVFLQKGINIIDIDTTAAVRLDYVNVSKAAVEPTAVVEAEAGSLTGEAAIGTNSDVRLFASKSGYVSGIKAANGVEVIQPGDPEFEIYGLGRTVDLGEAVDKNSLTIKVTVPEAGEYAMAVYQSSGELFGKHSYNAQMSERYASFAVNGGTAKKVVFRNTYSDETFRSQVVPVELKAGENTIKIYNDNSKVVTNGLHRGGSKIPANIDYNVLVNYTPNFDKFEFYPLTADVAVADEDTYTITAAYSEGGKVTADKLKVEKGETVTFTFETYENALLKSATVNGVSIMDSLTETGGTYVLSNVQEDITVKAIFEVQEYHVAIDSTAGGIVTASQTTVLKGGTVVLTFEPNDGYYLESATINGESISLHEAGGAYVLTDMQEDVTVKAVFGEGEARNVYAVNCGDINPTTLSSGDSFGTNNSVTDQFFGADPATGKQWGVVDTYVANGSYPDWLTGAKTWPCENDGATDSSPKEKSFRYARNQATTDVGIVYKFELEANKTYDLELGFYVPSSWTNSSNPRTMKLVLNGTTAAGYASFTASNDSANPYIINTTAAAGADGYLEIQIGHASNAKYGPVISYINIKEVIEGAAVVDKTELDAAVDVCKGSEQGTATAEQWNEYLNAYENAKYILSHDGFSDEDVKVATERLTAASSKVALRQNEVIAHFTFDDEETGFAYKHAVAAGSHSLQGRDGGNALYLDGTDDYLRVTADDGRSLLSDLDELTISFEAKPNRSSTGWLFYAAPDARTQNYNQEQYLGILDNNGSILAERYNNKGSRPANASVSVPSDWYHLTVVHTEEETIIYVNGQEAARQSSEYALADILGDNSILYIGKANWQTGEHYRGLIDNYCIMNYAMTADEVKDLYENGPKVEEPKVLPFEDVKEGAWYYDAVYNNYFADLMTGKSETIFAPKEALTRAQFALILYRIEGEPDVTSDKKFDDVSANSWYTDAVLWAYEAGIITGYANTNNFGPHDMIMREQMAVMMYRYAKTKNPDIAATGDLSKFADVGKVGDYAEEAMKWAVGAGIITGKDEVTLDPRGNTIRGEAAVVIDRFMNTYGK